MAKFLIFLSLLLVALASARRVPFEKENADGWPAFGRQQGRKGPEARFGAIGSQNERGFGRKGPKGRGGHGERKGHGGHKGPEEQPEFPTLPPFLANVTAEAWKEFFDIVMDMNLTKAERLSAMRSWAAAQGDQFAVSIFVVTVKALSRSALSITNATTSLPHCCSVHFVCFLNTAHRFSVPSSSLPKKPASCTADVQQQAG